MVETQKEANGIINGFMNDLNNLISEKLVGVVTKAQINEYFGYGNDCQLAEWLQETEEFDEELKPTCG